MIIKSTNAATGPRKSSRIGCCTPHMTTSGRTKPPTGIAMIDANISPASVIAERTAPW